MDQSELTPAGITDAWMNTETTTEVAQTGAGGVTTTTSCQLYSFFMRIFLLSTMILMGLIGNALTMRILWSDCKKSATVFLLFCLAMADSMLLLVYGVIGLPPAALRFMGRSVEALKLSTEIVAYFSPSGATSIMISMGLTVVVTWQRYLSVCMPYKVKTYGSLKLARIQALAVVLFSLVFNFPRWFEYKVGYDVPKPGLTALVPTSLFKNKTYEILYGIILYYLMFYILPMGALSYMTFNLVRALHQARIKRMAMVGSSSQSSRNRAKEELTISLVVVVIVFICCQFFGPVRRILIYFYPGSTSRQCGGVLFYFEAISLGATVTNSAINFIIYILCARRFRNQMRALCLCGRQKVHPEVTKGQSGHNLDDTFSQELQDVEGPVTTVERSITTTTQRGTQSSTQAVRHS